MVQDHQAKNQYVILSDAGLFAVSMTELVINKDDGEKALAFNSSQVLWLKSTIDLRFFCSF